MLGGHVGVRQAYACPMNMFDAHVHVRVVFSGRIHVVHLGA